MLRHGGLIFFNDRIQDFASGKNSGRYLRMSGVRPQFGRRLSSFTDELENICGIHALVIATNFLGKTLFEEIITVF